MLASIRGSAVLSFVLTATGLLGGCANAATALNGAQADNDGKLPAYAPRPGHARPVIAVLGANKGTELTDFSVPFGVLSESGVADVVTVSSDAGPIKTFTDMGKPGYRIVAQRTVAEFDAQRPDGADYVIVPALADSPEILQWLTQQANKGATLVSICNGGMVVSELEIMKGRHATAHWSTEDHRLEHHGDVHWVRNARYVADGNWISSAGVSAAMPTSIALVEAIAGRDQAATLAQRLGVSDWSAKHDSDAFQIHLGETAWPLAKVVYTNHWLHAEDRFDVPATAGVDEIALAMTVDAYSSTGRSRAYLTAASDAPLQTKHGLTVLPDPVAGGTTQPSQAVTLAADIPVGKVFDRALEGIAGQYGRSTAYGVALVLEYPNFKD